MVMAFGDGFCAGGGDGDSKIHHLYAPSKKTFYKVCVYVCMCVCVCACSIESIINAHGINELPSYLRVARAHISYLAQSYIIARLHSYLISHISLSHISYLAQSYLISRSHSYLIYILLSLTHSYLISRSLISHISLNHISYLVHS